MLEFKLRLAVPMFGLMNSTGNCPPRAPLQRAIALLGGIPLLIGSWQLVSVPLAFFVLFLLGSAMALTALFGGAGPILPPGRIARGLEVLTFGWVEMAAKLDSLTRPRW